MVDKLERDGQVAVIYSPGYGAGWSTWNADKYPIEDLVFNKELAEFLSTDPEPDWKAREAKAKELFPNAYIGGADELEIEWVPKNTPFYIHEYDGNEHVQTWEQAPGLIA